MQNRQKAVIEALAAFFLMLVSQSLCLAAVQSLLPGAAGADGALALGLSHILLLAALALMTCKLGHPFYREDDLRRPAGALPLVLCLAMGTAANLALSAGLSLLPLPDAFVAQYLQSVPLGKGAALAVDVAAICILAPIGEEILFRGVILRSLRQAMPLGAAVLLQCFLFAYGHGQLLWLLYAFAMGLALTALRLKTGSLRTGMAFHIAFNAANYLQEPLLSALGGGDRALILLLGCGLLLCGALALLLMRAYKKKS